MFKILGHSQNYSNDIADNLTNTGRHLHILDTCPSHLTNWSCHLNWTDTIIEQSLRFFLKQIFQTYTFDQWITNFSNLRLRAITHLIDWPLIWSCLNYQSIHILFLFELNHFRSFKVNCLNKSLPTLEKLKIIKPTFIRLHGIAVNAIQLKKHDITYGFVTDQ